MGRCLFFCCFGSDGSRDGQGCDAGAYGISTGDGVLRVGCGRDEDLTGYGGQDARCGIVIVLSALSPDSSLKGDGKTGENGIKGVADGRIVRCQYGAVARVLDDKGVGDLLVIHDLRGGDGFGNGKLRRRFYGNGFAGGGFRSDACRGCRYGVDDGAALKGRSKAVCYCLVYQYGIPACGHGDPRKGQRRARVDGGRGLRYAVDEEGSGARFVGQGINGRAAEFVCAQIIRQGHTGQRTASRIAQSHRIGDHAVGCIVVLDRCFTYRQYVQNFAVGNVGIGGVSVVGQGGLIGKNSHWFSSCGIVAGFPAFHSMPQKHFCHKKKSSDRRTFLHYIRLQMSFFTYLVKIKVKNAV